MIISVSLLNSPPDALCVLQRYGVTHVEIPLTYTIGKPWKNIQDEDLIILKDTLIKYNILPFSFQSVTFGLDFDICNLTKSERSDIMSHFTKIAHYGSLLGINHVVYGSPRTRVGTSDVKYVNFFQDIANILVDRGIKLCIENNAKVFGCNFGTNVFNLQRFLDFNTIDNVYINFDTVNQFIERQDVSYFPSVRTVHLSNYEDLILGYNDSYTKYVSQMVVKDADSITLENLNNTIDFDLSTKKFLDIVHVLNV